MKDAIQFCLIKIQLLWWLAKMIVGLLSQLYRLITPESEAVLAMTGGAWDDSMRRVVIELLLSEVRDE